MNPSLRARSIVPGVIRKLFEARRPTTVNLGFGEPGPRIPQELFDLGVERFRSEKPGYPPNAGLPALREAIAAYHHYPHLPAMKNVVVTVGVQEALFAAVLAVADPGDEIIVPEPAFPAYRTVCELLGVKVLAVPRRADFSLDADAVAAAIGERTRAVLVNSPSNPTGCMDSADDLVALARVTAKSGVWIIADEIYAELHEGIRPPSIASHCDRAIVLGALSKSCSFTGLRLGWAMVPDALSTAVAAVHQFNVTCAPSLSQYIALAAFAEAPRWLGVMRPHFAAHRRAMLEALATHVRLPHPPAEAGMYVFLDVSTARTPSAELAAALLQEADVLTIPGSAFGLGGEGRLRLTYGTLEAVEPMVEGIERLGEHLRKRVHESW